MQATEQDKQAAERAEQDAIDCAKRRVVLQPCCVIRRPSTAVKPSTCWPGHCGKS
ncbi:hypothetical protein ACFWFH_34285 [Streptomyces coelicoflavus]|uniref:hypothetical protein n=1 Tax=Streptomyces TaxID=1883 RepID=UPI001290F48C|nr:MULTISPECIES: hypothetical protein [unclassified Streptomyces]